MKKTFNINISGKVFTIDEDAYNMLSDYLDALGHAFKGFEESSDLTEDIEQRVAELLTEHQEATRSEVVTISEVESIISRIGRPEEFLEIDEIRTENDGADEDEEETIVNERSAAGAVPPPVPPVTKRLFRDPENKMLGGVCGGLGAYLNIDPTWIRLLFVALFFFSYSTIFIVYILLWIILPEARTPFQLMQMKGEPTTVENIGRKVTSYYRGEDYAPGTPQPTGWRSIPGYLSTIFSVIVKIVLIMIAIIAVPVVLALGIAFFAILIALIVYAATSITILDFPISDRAETIWALVFCLTVVISFGIPLTMLVVSLFRNNSKKEFAPMSSKWKISLVVVWIASILMAGISAKILSNEGTVMRLTQHPSTVIELNDKELDSTETELEAAETQLEAVQDALDDATDALDATSEALETKAAVKIADRAVKTAGQARSKAAQTVKESKVNANVKNPETEATTKQSVNIANSSSVNESK